METIFQKLIYNIYKEKLNLENIKPNKYYIYFNGINIIYLGKILNNKNKKIFFEKYILSKNKLDNVYYSNKPIYEEEDKLIEILKENTLPFNNIFPFNCENYIRIILERDRIAYYNIIIGFKLEHPYDLYYEEMIEENNEQLSWTIDMEVSQNTIGKTDKLILCL